MEWYLNLNKEPNLSIISYFDTYQQIGRDIIRTTKEVFEKLIDHGTETIRKRKIKFDSMQAAYCIEQLMKKNYELLLKYSNDKNVSLRWIEVYSMLNHAYGESEFPENVETFSPPLNEIDMSRLIVREQIRLIILSKILASVVEWSIVFLLRKPINRTDKIKRKVR